MKKIFLFVCILAFVLGSNAQSPVTWSFNAKKLGGNLFEVHLTATLQNGWHAFSQTQPKDAIPLPTKISFDKNPLIELKGKTGERGILEMYEVKTLGLEQYQYSGKVDFVQTVVLKAKVKTNLAGSIRYQVCNDHECLPGQAIKFSLVLE